MIGKKFENCYQKKDLKIIGKNLKIVYRKNDMKIAALVSGGKDSVFAVQKMIEAGYDVVCLVCLTPQNNESYMYHCVNTSLVQSISQACGIPLFYQSTSGIKEEELTDMELILSRLILELGIAGVCAGAIESAYQKSRIEKVCGALNLASFFPLWKADPEQLLMEMIQSGMDILFAAAAADGLDESWLGRRLDMAALADLKKLNQTKHVHIAGEGGEFETAVLDAPFFSKKIVPVLENKRWYGNRGFYDILETKLISKN
jgi:ABC transporter with metal-binding/Fe-S-binding domain ATP-binding protein